MQLRYAEPMRRTSFSDFRCSIARTLEIVGEWWTPLILRDVILGVNRFDDMQRDLGIARNVLTDRLDALVEGGILERQVYQERPLRQEYALTEKGRDLAPVLLAMMAWGDRWTAGDEGAPVQLHHESCGEFMTPEVRCSCCSEPLELEDLTAHPGPGGRIGPGAHVVGERLAEAPRRLVEAKA